MTRKRYQFGLGGLMLLMVAVALCLAVARWWGVGLLILLLVYASCVLGLRLALKGDACVFTLKCLSLYCLASTLTLPFLDSIWLGELPVLALVQVPKVQLADWLRSGLVMKIIVAMGWSRGSFSPDYIMARPYGLAIAYVVPLAIVLTTVTVRTRLVQPYFFWTCIVMAVALVDFCCTLLFAGGPGLTIY